MTELEAVMTMVGAMCFGGFVCVIFFWWVHKDDT